MSTKNICKFVSTQVPKNLTVYNFVLETDRDNVTKVHKLEHNRLILINAGACVFNINRTRINAEVGDIVFCFVGETFCVEEHDKALEYMYVSFDGIRSSEIFNRFGIDTDNRHFKGFNGILPLWRESLSHASELTIDLTAEGVLLYTLSRFDSEETMQETVVGKMIKITKERFSEPNLSIDVLSQDLSYNSKYLSHIFKAKMGVKYSDYLRATRLKFAVSLFDNGLTIVKNVALLSGFSDPLYFSTVFKRNIGVTPKKYIQTKYEAE